MFWGNILTREVHSLMSFLTACTTKRVDHPWTILICIARICRHFLSPWNHLLTVYHQNFLQNFANKGIKYLLFIAWGNYYTTKLTLGLIGNMLGVNIMMIPIGRTLAPCTEIHIHRIVTTLNEIHWSWRWPFVKAAKGGRVGLVIFRWNHYSCHILPMMCQLSSENGKSRQ